MGLLNARGVAGLLKQPGKHKDGDGLFLVVGASGAASWLLRIQHQGKRRDIGLGSYPTVGLADAREAAAETRKQLRAGVDVVAKKRAKPEQVARIPTFAEVAREVHRLNVPGWKNEKHGKQWLSSLETHVFPRIGKSPVNEVGSAEILRVLLPVWLTIPETARRVRQRIGAVLDYSYAKGWRDAEAPVKAVSRGLPKQPSTVRHHAAMPWAGVPKFFGPGIDNLNCSPVIRAALRFLILTAARSGEVRGATWGEIDPEAELWTVPGHRMKAGREHSVPLSSAALAILQQAKAWRLEEGPGALIFPGERAGRPLSDMSLSMPIRRGGYEATPHGMRSVFRDWCGDATSFPREVAEACLAHVVGGVEGAYRRGSALEKRREIMQLWADFLTGDADEKVVQMPRRGA